jgi:hypothetical protein
VCREMRSFDAQLYTSFLASAVRGVVGRHRVSFAEPFNENMTCPRLVIPRVAEQRRALTAITCRAQHRQTSSQPLGWIVTTTCPVGCRFAWLAIRALYKSDGSAVKLAILRAWFYVHRLTPEGATMCPVGSRKEERRFAPCTRDTRLSATTDGAIFQTVGNLLANNASN